MEETVGNEDAAAVIDGSSNRIKPGSPPTVHLSFPAVTPCLVRHNQSLTIVADITGRPTPSVSWYVGKSPVTEQCPRYQVIVPQSSASSRCLTSAERKCYRLHVKRVGDELHRKTLSVTASNEFGSDSCVVDLLTYRGTIMHRAP
jgi:hypothetical protein